MTWSSALRRTVRRGLTIERTRLEPLIALRGAFGVAVVIGLVLWLGSPTLAVSSAFGAFSAGSATFQRSWRPRPVLALAAAFSLAVSTFIGYLAAGHPVWFAVLLAAWALLAGMAWAAGPVIGMLAAQTVSVMLVTLTLPTSVLGALVHAGLIAFGGLVQALLIVLIPIRPWGTRRDALADALAAVADFARDLRQEPTAPFDPQPLMDARNAAALTPRQARRRPGELSGYRGLAERIRLVLASLADPVVGAPREGPERDRVRELLAAAGTVLDAVARAIRRGTPIRLAPPAMSVLEVPESGTELSGATRRGALRLSALLDDAVESATEPVEFTGLSDGEVRRYLPQQTVPGLVPVVLRALRREAHPSSPVFRHAVRVAVVTLAGYELGEALPLGHGYWVPLTSIMVMRPHFGQTYQRAVGRFAGTLVGVLFAGTVVALARPGTLPSALLAVLCTTLYYLLMRTGYAVVSACVAGYVVFLLEIAGGDWSQTVHARVALTALGGALALIAQAFFPAWETPRLRERLADWLEANGRYTLAVLDAFADPAGAEPRRVRVALLDSRAARAAWDRTVERADAEPVRHRGLSPAAERAAESALITMGRAAMLLEAHLPEPDARPSDGAAVFESALDDSLPAATEAVRDGQAFGWPEPHAAYAAWQERDGETDVRVRGAGLLMESLDELALALSPDPQGAADGAGHG